MLIKALKNVVSAAAVAVCAAAFGGDLALQPIPETAVLSEEGYFVWGGSIVKDDGGTYHLFYSRWKKSEGVRAWRPHAEIARATSKDLFGTFTPQGVVLPERGGRFWDGHSTYNPTVHKFGSKYYLYYAGNVRQDGTEGCIAGASGSNQRSKDNNQRVGVAVADGRSSVSSPRTGTTGNLRKTLSSRTLPFAGRTEGWRRSTGWKGLSFTLKTDALSRFWRRSGHHGTLRVSRT